MYITQNVNLNSGDTFSEISVYDNIGYLLDQIHSNQISPRFRIYVLFPDETVNYLIPNEDIKSGGSYSENYQDGQRRSLSFSLYNYEKKYSPSINTLWAGTRLRLDMGVEFLDGTVAWIEKGIYVVTQITPSLSAGDFTVQVQASDKFAIFENKVGTLEDTYEIPVESNIELVIHDILLLDMGNGDALDPATFVYNSSFKGKTTQQKITKSAGDTYGSILKDLATQLSAEIFYNSTGQLTFVPLNEVSLDVDKPLLDNFYEEHGDFTNFDFTYSLTEIVNRIIVMGSSDNFCKAVALNGDPSSPLCYQRIGYRTGSPINDSNITTQYLAEERAQYELRKQLILKSSTSLTILYNPLLSVNNLVSVTSESFEITGEKFLIQSLSCNLDYAATMTLSISNIRNFESLTTT